MDNTEATLPANYIHTVIEPPKGWAALELGELWKFRELLFFLTWRDIKVRYKQTALGAAWAILQPVLTMVVFSIIFGGLARLPSEGIPYPIFTFTALLPWQLFAFALTQSSNSLVGSQNLISKVYFPRLVVPFSSVLAGVVDFGIAFLVLVGLMAYYGIGLTPAALLLPVFLLLALTSALAIGLWLSALNVKYRDIRYVVPFLTQFWMYATPIAYSSSLIPEKWRWLYSLNPMTGVVEGFRWAILGKSSLDVLSMSISAGMVVTLLIGGLYYFKRMESSFADIL
ncbi:MAG: phosphate ABC transporter permease [Chloroflexi bacterium GWB2_49_20]|nr:MAG: phosphate ABC transporter permease [Chloroflexi bacterium GWB2_49_20]OGN78247.1 MAG: phosphate ABC transporter permease [Chloroflexi bacterium GWC2_49_37]OGN85283.1 MAG: phosphate ABC transporter permease [Chloroflexi bacterium GWD2_49_16]